MLEQISIETKYWNDIVIRVISVIKFLTSRGLSLKALKCISENNSENGDSKRDAKMFLK